MRHFLVLISLILTVKAVQYKVSNSAELTKALNVVLPGDVITLADGIYDGNFKAYRNGTATQPIKLNGTRNAVLCNLLGWGQGLLLSANYWILDGFSVANSRKGIMLENANFNLLNNLNVHHVSEEGVHFLKNSSDNTIQNSVISYTGLIAPGFGEGVYIGSASNKWNVSFIDISNRNKVLYNFFGPNVAAEAIDIKEGTESGLIEGNYFDGTNMSGENYGDSWMEIKGAKYIIRNNSGSTSLTDGFQVYQVPNSVPNSGCENLIKDNICHRLGVNGICVRLLGKFTCQNNQITNNIVV